MKSFAQDIRDVLVPQRKWHYIFHVLVMLVASSYWVGSLVKVPEASLAEIAMYRPRGDNQVYPVIAALSRFNLGDPTDSLKYGEGTAGTQVVVLLPYAIAYRLFGEAGYIVGDVALSWVYFVALTVFLRRCNFGNFSSLVMACALATRSFQILCNKIGYSITVIMSLFGVPTWEWGFPDLFDSQIFVQRIPRPMGTETFMVLLLYSLMRQWQERRLPSMRRGLAIGGLMALILQGDPFLVSTLGLLLLWVMGCTLAANQWRIPWRFVGGALAGALICGSYFLWQRVFEHPDSAVRFGLADYARDRIWLLPGYGPIIRVSVVCIFGWLVLRMARRQSDSLQPSTASLEDKNSRRNQSKRTDAVLDTTTASAPSANVNGIERSVATFCLAFVIAAWIAQPAQLFLLGKGSQIYHYLLYVLPTVYAYCVVILGYNFLKLTVSHDVKNSLRSFALQPRWASATLLGFIMVVAGIVGMENKLSTVFSLSNARQETNVPWVQGGDMYRPCLRGLERQFKTNPVLKETRSFATFCYEVNFLLAGFHEKRAFLPDNAYSTLSDDELETRLLEVLKILHVPADQLADCIQANFMLNYWLGCAKYWMTSDYQYSTREDYTEEQWSNLLKQPKQTPWFLCLPNSEIQRLSEKYQTILAQESNLATYPDAIIVGLEKSIGLIPSEELYSVTYTNRMFSVYVKKPGTALGQLSVNEESRQNDQVLRN